MLRQKAFLVIDVSDTVKTIGVKNRLKFPQIEHSFVNVTASVTVPFLIKLKFCFEHSVNCFSKHTIINKRFVSNNPASHEVPKLNKHPRH